jgi:hypothetical protein
MQVAIIDLEDGKAQSAYKLKYFCNGNIIKSEAWIED